jgi:hydroxymethylbilane synthase
MSSGPQHPIRLATRGSPLALAQARFVLDLCCNARPDLAFELQIVRTTGDKLQTASLANPQSGLPKGLFTKELESALLDRSADLAVHSLKDLPTTLPDGLALVATPPREDPRDVLIYRARCDTGAARGMPPFASIPDLPASGVVATSSTRRREQTLALRPDLRCVEIRGNVGTRLEKIARQLDWDATLLAAAGLKRLGYAVEPDGALHSTAGQPVPPNLLATLIDPRLVVPAVGQAAIGIEARADDPLAAAIVAPFNDPETFQCVTAERAFLRAMGGGCQSPIAAHATRLGDRIAIHAISFHLGPPIRAHIDGSVADAAALGETLAHRLLHPPRP